MPGPAAVLGTLAVATAVCVYFAFQFGAFDSFSARSRQPVPVPAHHHAEKESSVDEDDDDEKTGLTPGAEGTGLATGSRQHGGTIRRRANGATDGLQSTEKMDGEHKLHRLFPAVDASVCSYILWDMFKGNLEESIEYLVNQYNAGKQSLAPTPDDRTSDVATLRRLFPKTQSELLDFVLDSYNGDLRKSINFLLSQNDVEEEPRLQTPQDPLVASKETVSVEAAPIMDETLGAIPYAPLISTSELNVSAENELYDQTSTSARPIDVEKNENETTRHSVPEVLPPAVNAQEVTDEHTLESMHSDDDASEVTLSQVIASGLPLPKSEVSVAVGPTPTPEAESVADQPSPVLSALSLDIVDENEESSGPGSASSFGAASDFTDVGEAEGYARSDSSWSEVEDHEHEDDE